MDDETFNEIARHNFIIRLVAGFIFGIIAAITGIILLIALMINKQTDVAIMMILLIVVGLLVSGSCGYFLFSRRKNNKKETE